ncbi:MAG: ribosome recycling factor [Clostridiales bacterium]|nr:ribosome recycling factor [Clostridiales bacterium]
MTVKEILDLAKEKMGKSIAVYQDNMASIRAGRANPKLLDHIMVDYYGTPTPLPQVGSVSVPEARMIVIKPWEKSMIKAIEKAINLSDLGINPNNDGEVVRLIFPELNTERRKDLTKQVKKEAEDAKVAVRSIRRDAIENVKKLKKDSLITEDEQRKAEEDAQKLTDKAIKDVDAICAAKEKEIMEV